MPTEQDGKAIPNRTPQPELAPLAISDGGSLPDELNAPATLPEVLQRAAQTTAGIVYCNKDAEILQSYAQLLKQAERILAGLRKFGLQAGDKVILQLSNSDIIPAFWGCILGGFVPVIMEVPPTYQEPNPALYKLRHIWEFLDKPLVIASEVLQDSAKSLSQWAVKVCWIESLIGNEPDQLYHPCQPHDIAFLNLTSGSTGIPKCIQLTHHGIIARARGANILNQYQPDDVILNWLPFDHIGSISDWHIRCLELGCKVVYAPKKYILGRALSWLDLIDKYRITHSWAPNFAYTLVNDLLEQEPEQNWDLSCVQVLLTAGEAIAYQAVQDFIENLAAYGLPKKAIRPAFGMAELGSGITYYQPAAPAIHRVDKSSLEGTIKRVAAGYPHSTIFTNLGSVIPGVAIRIVNNQNVVLPEDTIGCLQVKGDAVFPGYYKNPQANQEAFVENGWFNTGDLGFIANGQLVLTGRVKETIIINGANYYSHEIEAVVEEIEGVEVSYTAACAVRDRATEKLAIFFNCSVEVDEDLLALLRRIRRTVVSKVGVNPDYLVPVAKEAVPKTAIGKIQRQQLSHRFCAGEFDVILKQVDDLGLGKSAASYSAKTGIERQIAQIWQEVLGLEEVGIHDNFFELGGNSLLLLQLQHRLQEQLGCQLAVADMFRYPTINALAKFSQQTRKTTSQQQQRTYSGKRTGVLDIAVIGMSCRFPGANTIDEFWQNLSNGVESISVFTDEEILASGVDPKLLNNPNYVKANPILSDVESFDAEFFGYSPKEAQLIDPQQRLLLECAWESLEDAGYASLGYKGSIGIYAGAVMNTYLLNNVYPNRHQLDPNDNLQITTLDSTGGFQMMVANDKDYLTTRVSYKLNLTGPSVNVQTACSTSLVAIHMACQSLLNGECDMVLAGGVSVQVPQKIGYLYQEGTIVSPDGHCRAFDAGAKGTIFGSGVGIVVLKRLEEAIADRDRLYAVIKGSAINNDGGTKVGYLAPNGDGQARVAASAMALASVAPETIGYVETHGTGTVLGDPIEIAGLTQAFRATTQKQRFCAIGSVKTNVGHLQIASGVAGFIKTVLSLHHKKLPPSLHFETPNPQIDFANSPFYVNTTLQDWQTTGYPRRAGINSLGVGGTNAHVILEEAPLVTRAGGVASPKLNRPLHILTLSAKTEKALQELAQDYQEFLAKYPEVSLPDVCFTANTGRCHFTHRLAVVAASVKQLRLQLNIQTGKEATGLVKGRAASSQPEVVFLFTGQGSQYVGMGYQLYETQPTFRQTLERCDQILRPYLDKPLLEVLYPQGVSSQESALPNTQHPSLLDQTAYTQPALFALEYALFKLWKSWGIEPAVVLGHSVGEYVAAVVAGVFSLEDGLKLIAARGRLMQALPTGEMVAVFTDESQVRAAIAQEGALAKRVSIAVINSDRSIVISGHPQALQTVVATLEAQGVKTKPLNVSHAFHSSLMEPMLAEFEQIAREITYSPPNLDLVSNITGELVTAEIATPQYWCRHIRQPVKFAASIKTLHKAGYKVFLECGPKPILLGMARSCLPEGAGVWLPSLRPLADWQQILESLAQLYVRGVPVDWCSFDRDYPRGKMALPTYPFQRQRYWIEPEPRRAGGETQPPSKLQKRNHPLLGQRLPSALKEILFQSALSADTPAFLKDHCVYQEVVLPGAAYIEMALAAAAAVLKSEVVLEDVVIQQALMLSEPQTVQLILSKQSAGYSFEIYSFTGDESWKLHSSGRIVEADSEPTQVELERLRSQFNHELSVADHYHQCRERGIDYGSSFRAIAQLWGQEREALGLIQIPEELVAASNYQLHPAILDACFQVVFAVPQVPSGTYLPVGLERLRVYRSPGQNLWSYVQIRPPVNNSNQSILKADLRLFDETGLVAQVDGLLAQQASRKALLGIPTWQDWMYKVEWHPQERVERITKRGESLILAASQTSSWLILADRGGIGQQLAALLRSKQQTCILVFPEEYPSQQRLLDAVGTEHRLHGVIHLWSLDTVETDYLTGKDLEVAARQGCGSTLNLIQALGRGFSHPPRLWLVTRGAQPVEPSTDVPEVAQSCLWGMGKVIALEHPELNCVRIDLDPRSPANEAQALFAELWSPDTEDQVAFRDGIRQVARLVHLPQAEQPNFFSQPLQLEISTRGTLDNLKWQPTSHCQLGYGEIEIQVRATGLNFRDVLNVLGLYPGDPGFLGLECAGEVVAVGEGVAGIDIEDAVVAIAPGSFSRYVTVNANLAIAKPEFLSFEEAATIPGAFLTAYYALHYLAKIKPGDKVLIHAATGGVGQAAVQLAQQAGAEVFATASPGKWEFLKLLGVEQIMNSRTLDFAEQVMSITQGKGVDIVLNSLAGDFIAKSLSILSVKGRFVEIGKQGIWDASQVAQLKPDVAYFICDLIQVAQQQPALIQSMLRGLMQQFQVGSLTPLPRQVFPMHRVIDAFRYMQQAKHIGKIVVSQQPLVRSDGTYLITGGLGDLGLLVAQWLLAQGAKHLVLVGRSKTKDTAKKQWELEQAGASVVIAQADVAETKQIAAVLAEIKQSLPPLRGIIHAAGILDDSFLQQQSWERFEAVMAPKVKGAWNLHILTRDRPLDFFVMFSSVASLFGSAGQASYAAANAFLDALAYTRLRKGLPSLTINWGAWSQVGIAAKRQLDKLGIKGMGAIAPQQGLAILEELLAQPAALVGVVPIDWSQWQQAAASPFFANLVTISQPAATTYLQQLAAATNSDRRELIVTHVRSEVAKILGLNSVNHLDLQQGFAELGMDSLTSVELRNRLQSSLECTLPSTLVFDYPTVATLSDYLAQKLLVSALNAEQPQEQELDSTMTQIQQLSESEAEAMLLDQLNNLN